MKRNGFSLVELMVVMVILAIAGSVVVLRPGFDPLRQDGTPISKFVSHLTRDRDTAILQQKTVSRGFDAVEGAWVGPGGVAVYRLPDDVRIYLSRTQVDDWLPCVFRPDGSGCRLSMVLETVDERWSINVHPVTGRASQVRLAADDPIEL